MEGQIYIPLVDDTDLVNIPPVATMVTLFIDSGNSNQLKAKKHDNTILSAAAGASAVLFA